MLRAAEELLSQQLNYDFGMRALKSVLLAAGASLRSSTAQAAHSCDDAEVVHEQTTSQELTSFVQTLHEMLLPKLTSRDSVVVEGLIKVLCAMCLLPCMVSLLSMCSVLKFKCSCPNVPRAQYCAAGRRLDCPLLLCYQLSSLAYCGMEA